MDQSLLVAILVFLLVVQAVLLAVPGTVTEREYISNRLTAYTAPAWQTSMLQVRVLRRRRYSRLPWLDVALARFDLADGLSRQLQQAGLPLRAGEFLFLQLIAATLGGLVGALVGWELLGGPAAAVLGLAIGFFAPLPWLKLRISRR